VLTFFSNGAQINKKLRNKMANNSVMGGYIHSVHFSF